MKLTAKALMWATEVLQRFDTLVSTLAHQPDVPWHTGREAVKGEGTRRISVVSRLAGEDAPRRG